MLQPEGDEADLIEHHRFRWNAAVKRQLEFFRGRERVNVMSNVVAVRENDRGADLNRRHVRNELLVALVDDGVPFGRYARGAGGSNIGNGIGTRPALVVLDDDLQRPGQEITAKTKTVSSTNPRDGLISIRHGDVRFHHVVLVLQRIVRGDGILVAELNRSCTSSVDRQLKTKVHSCVQQFVGGTQRLAELVFVFAFDREPGNIGPRRNSV